MLHIQTGSTVRDRKHFQRQEVYAEIGSVFKLWEIPWGIFMLIDIVFWAFSGRDENTRPADWKWLRFWAWGWWTLLSHSATMQNRRERLTANLFHYISLLLRNTSDFVSPKGQNSALTNRKCETDSHASATGLGVPVLNREMIVIV